MAPSDIGHQRGPPILGPCRHCGENAAMYADSSQERWYKNMVSRGDLTCMPFQCVECRQKGSGVPLPESPAPPPSPTPRFDTLSSTPTPSPTPPQTQSPAFAASPSAPTPSPPSPLSPVDGPENELVRTQGDPRRAQDALAAAATIAALRLKNSELERRLAETKLASAQERLVSVEAMLAAARAELKIKRPRPRTSEDERDADRNESRPGGWGAAGMRGGRAGKPHSAGGGHAAPAKAPSSGRGVPPSRAPPKAAAAPRADTPSFRAVRASAGATSAGDDAFQFGGGAADLLAADARERDFEAPRTAQPRLLEPQMFTPSRSPLTSSPPPRKSPPLLTPFSRGPSPPPAPAPPPAPSKAAFSAPRFDPGGRLYAVVEASPGAATAHLDRRGAMPQDEDAAPLGGGGGGSEDSVEDGDSDYEGGSGDDEDSAEDDESDYESGGGGEDDGMPPTQLDRRGATP